jgi:hypothetical protein
MSSGQIERDFGAVSDVLTQKRGSTDPRYFQAQTTACVSFPWLPAPEEMPVTVPSLKTVDAYLPGNVFGVPDIYAKLRTGTCFCGIFQRSGAGIFSVLYRTGEVTFFYRHIAFFHGILYVYQYKTEFALCNMFMPCVLPQKYMNMPVSNVQSIFEGHEFCVS